MQTQTQPPKPGTLTLADDSFEDKAIAQVAVGLHVQHGQMTNAAFILVRPTDVRGDESGAHPGESFVQLMLTRQEIEAMLTGLNDDWALHLKYTSGTPS